MSMRTAALRRREFLTQCAAVTAGASVMAQVVPAAWAMESKEDWLEMLEDPVRKLFHGRPNLDKILLLFPRTTGVPAFDPDEIAAGARRLQAVPAIATGHPFLDLSVKIGLAHIDATFQGDHPKYGVGTYAHEQHDGFPPTIIAAVDALSAWGMARRAAELFRYWLVNFVDEHGRLKYYGPSIAEYGQLLHTAALLEERAGPEGWWNDGFGPLDRIATLLVELQADAATGDGLISGVPEADTRKDQGKFFHNNGWVVRGLREWAELCQRRGAAPSVKIATASARSRRLQRDTLHAIQQTWPSDPDDWWLPPKVELIEKPARLIVGMGTGSYTNYRYWPELLSSGILPTDLANRVVDARLSAGGQFCGMTRFSGHLDDWPLADYLAGLWSLGRKNDFLLSLYGHAAYHQAENHLTAYEQVTFPPGRKAADYCLPCQLVVTRAARRLVASHD